MADIGATLREARMRAKIDINEVERRTKIRAKYLRAIENEEWDLLPGEVYVKSFLRTYGDFLGLDSRQLIDEYKRRYERPSDHDLRPISSRSRDRDRERRPRGPLIPPWAVIGFVLLAIVVGAFGFFATGQLHISSDVLPTTALAIAVVTTAIAIQPRTTITAITTSALPVWVPPSRRGLTSPSARRRRAYPRNAPCAAACGPA
jgi:transcriptional regulator with XRE-family HTH domain